MPAFKVLSLDGKAKERGQLQEVQCPRCRDILVGEENTTFTNGNQTRVVKGIYKCSCGYSVIVIENFPVISRATN